MKRLGTTVALATFAVGGCNSATSTSIARIPETEAAAAADATQRAWISMNPLTIESVYARDIVGFDPTQPELSATWDNWAKLQAGFAGMQLDAIKVDDRKIQVLDDKDFVVSGTGVMTSSQGKTKTVSLRFTDVYHKQDNGKFLIVNEHVSLVPKES